MTDRELLQQALDTLRHLCLHSRAVQGYDGEKVQSGIDALKSRLAQPEPAECDGGQCGIGGYCKQCPKTQSEQKPVAWISHNAGLYHGKPDESLNPLPLYTAPPQRKEWVGLTREELEEISEFHFHGALSGREFYDDVEAKLKEKNI